jgi:hypothetical protein
MEVRDGMTNLLRVRWTLLAVRAPEPWLDCPGCGGVTAYRSSGKLRVNANGRRIDAWLVYRCTGCDRVWNRPILERAAVRQLAPCLLDRLMANAPEVVRAVAFDIAGLRARARRVESFGATVRKERLGGAVGWERLRLELRVPEPVGVRLDRLLAVEFGLSRAGIGSLFGSGAMRVAGGAARRPVVDGAVVEIAPGAERAVWEAGALSPPPVADAPGGGGRAASRSRPPARRRR